MKKEKKLRRLRELKNSKMPNSSVSIVKLYLIQININLIITIAKSTRKRYLFKLDSITKRIGKNQGLS